MIICSALQHFGTYVEHIQLWSLGFWFLATVSNLQQKNV